MDWYPRNPAHYRRSTIGWRDLALHGAYNLLIDYYYMTGEPIPDNDETIATILGCDLSAWLAVADRVRAKFERKGGLLRQNRCDEELSKQARIAEKSRENGKRGGRPKRKTNKENNPAVTQAKPKGYPAGHPQTDRQTDKDSSLRSESAAAKPKPTNLPVDWLASEANVAYAKERGFDSQHIADIAADFLTYWTLGGGRTKKHLNWDRAWESWVRREKPRNGHRPGRLGMAAPAPAAAFKVTDEQRADQDARLKSWGTK